MLINDNPEGRSECSNGHERIHHYWSPKYFWECPLCRLRKKLLDFEDNLKDSDLQEIFQDLLADEKIF